VDPASDRARRGVLAKALARQLVAFTVSLLLSLSLLQLLLFNAPGDAIDLLPNAAELRPELEAQWGLDRPLPERLGQGLQAMARGDWGYSVAVRTGTPVLELLAATAPRSLGVLLPAMGLQLLLALGLALLTRGRRPIVRAAIQLGSALPLFLMLLAAVTLLNEGAWALVQSGRLERPSWFALPDQPSALRWGLATFGLAWASSALGEAHADVELHSSRLLSGPHLTACRARGEPILLPLLHNLLPELLALGARRLPTMLGGLVIAEKVLLIQGTGALLWDACLLRDHPLALGIAATCAALVATTTLGSESLRLWIDPRLRAQP